MTLKADLKVCLTTPSQVAIERPHVRGNFARCTGVEIFCGPAPAAWPESTNFGPFEITGPGSSAGAFCIWCPLVDAQTLRPDALSF